MQLKTAATEFYFHYSSNTLTERVGFTVSYLEEAERSALLPPLLRTTSEQFSLHCADDKPANWPDEIPGGNLKQHPDHQVCQAGGSRSVP